MLPDTKSKAALAAVEAEMFIKRHTVAVWSNKPSAGDISTVNT